MEKIDDRCWGLLSNGFVEAQAHPQSLDHHVDGGFGVSVIFEGMVPSSGYFGALYPAHPSKVVMLT